MPAKNYYLILGVPPTETARGIQRAFRRLAKAHHPDRVGPEGTGRFQDIVEAYEVLSDPARRRAYDQTTERVVPIEDFPAEPIFDRYHSRVEPLAPETMWQRNRTEPEPLRPEPVSLLRDFATFRPSAEELVERILWNFTGVGAPKSEHMEGLTVEVVLSPREAARGGVLRLAVPVFSTCPACGGSGQDWLLPCLHCMRQGVIEEEEILPVRIPPGVEHGSVIEMPLHGYGIHNFYLRLQIRIGV